MISKYFVYLSALIILVGDFSYIVQTAKGKAHPNRVSWLLWALIPMITFAAEIKQGVGLQALMTFMVGFGPFIVLAVSLLDKKAYWKLSNFDIFCGVLSVLAIIAWQLTGNGNTAILLSIIADIFAAIPTIIKSLKNPESEHYGVYLSGVISGVITLLTIKNWTVAEWGFPLYVTIMCLLLVTLVTAPKWKKLKI